jgi:hypothetical protein
MIGTKVIMILIVLEKKEREREQGGEGEKESGEMYCRDGAHIARLHVSVFFLALCLQYSCDCI